MGPDGSDEPAVTASYRLGTAYRNGEIYRRGFRAAPLYRSGLTYRNPQSYRSNEAAPGTGAPGRLSGGTFGWDRSARAAATTSLRYDAPASVDAGLGAPWSALGARGAVSGLATAGTQLADESWQLPWADHLAQHDESTSLVSDALDAVAAGTAMPWADFDGQHARATGMPWSSPAAQARGWNVPWGRLAAHAMSRSVLWRRIVERGGYVALPWSPIAARSSSTVVVWPPTPPTDDETIVVPELPVYVMLPTLTAVRLPDRTPIPLLSVSLQEEIGGFVWSFTAPMSRAGLALVNPDDGSPPQIEVAVNGHVWTFVVDGYDDNRRFGSNTLTLRGRSLAALLTSPHASTRTYTQTEERTVSQLAAEELPVGWTLLWDAVDWLVPGDTFSYADLAPVEAISQLASAIGAAVQSDPALPQLQVVPTYSTSPWAWPGAAPYAILPAAVISEGSSSWKGGVNPDGVYVYAQNAASGAFVKLTGSAGAVQLPMVVDPLLVTPDAQRERGRHELASHGRARTVQRTVPLFPTPAPTGMPELGVVRPGRLVEVEDLDETWRGMVTSVRIDAQRSGRALSVRQHLTIERQYR